MLKHLRSLTTQNAKSIYATEWGLSLGVPNPFDKLAFDRHLQTPQDPAHILLQCVTKTLVSATLDLFSPAGSEFFVKKLANFPLPPRWSRFQNPIHHLKSYYFSDYARLMMIGPFLLLDILRLLVW